MSKFPFLRIFVSVTLGIYLANWLPISIPILCICTAIFLGATLFFALPGYKKWHVSYNRWLGLSVCLCLFFVAVLRQKTYLPSKENLPIGRELLVKAQIVSGLKAREKTNRVEAELETYAENGEVFDSRARLLLYFSKEIPDSLLRYANRIIFKTRVGEIEQPKNPGEFNLVEHNARKGIYHRAYVNVEQLVSVEMFRGFSFYRTLNDGRHYLLDLTGSRFISPVEKALAEALVLGYQDDLDDETTHKFIRSGTSHVLAVSGLHVGILWMAVDMLLFFMNRNKSLRLTKFFISLILLWVYAFLTGLSPSVLRAAIMFSGLATASLLNSKYIALNILFVSASLQLYMDPSVLYNIGFQLSYAAVASILLFYVPIRDLLYLKQKYKRWLWETTALTLAAQVLTTPISLYWFGQFPVWFIFSNMVLVPLSSFALGVGLLSVVLTWLPLFNDLLFHVFMLSIKLMDSTAGLFSTLPMALLYINMGTAGLVFSYILIGLVSVFILTRKADVFRYILVLVCIVLAWDIHNNFRKKSSKLILYSLKQGTVIRHYQGEDVWEYKSSEVDKKGYAYSVSPSNRMFNVSAIDEALPVQNFLYIGGKKIVLLQETHYKILLDEPVHCDWILVESLKYIDFKRLVHNFQFQKLILSGGISFRQRERWLSMAEEYGIDVYDVWTTGYLEENLNI